MPEPQLDDRGLIEAAQRALSAAWAQPDLRLGSPEVMRDWGRHRLLRAALMSELESCPETVVLKASVAAEGGSGIAREAAALRFLGRIPALERRIPRMLAADLDSQILLLEDLGDGPALFGFLQDSDSSSAEAESALITLVEHLAAIHAASLTEVSSFEAAAHGLLDSSALDARMPAGGAAADQVAAALEALGLSFRPDWQRALDEALSMLTEPGPFSGFVQRDPCLANVVRAKRGWVLIDFEFAGLGHVLVDGAFPWIRHLFCLNGGLALPAELQARMQAHYRRRLAESCPEAADDSIFERHLAAACVFWLARLIGPVPTVLDQDRDLDPKTERQRILAALDEYRHWVPRVGPGAAFAELAEALTETLGQRWSGTPALDGFRALKPS